MVRKINDKKLRREFLGQYCPKPKHSALHLSPTLT